MGGNLLPLGQQLADAGRGIGSIESHILFGCADDHLSTASRNKIGTLASE